MDARNTMAGIAAAALAVTGVVVVRGGPDVAAAADWPVLAFSSQGIDGDVDDQRPRWLLRVDEDRLRQLDPSLSANDRALVDSLVGTDREALLDPSLLVSALVTDLPGVEEATRIDDDFVAVVGDVDPVDLAATPGVEAVEVDPIVHPAQTDPLLRDLWGLANDGQTIQGQQGTPGADIGWREAREHTGEGVVVAVIDSGVDLDHPDLAARTWQNPGEVCGNLVDDDANGYVDDCNGWDFARGDGTVDDPGADNEHGTHVAGTIAATADDGVGVAGVAPRVRIMPLKVFDGGGAPSSRSALALRYAVDNGAQVVNMSLGGSPGGPMPSSMAAAVQHALEQGVVVVAAAGNSGVDIDRYPVYPASFHHDNVVTVGASDNRDRPAHFSNYGQAVELFAPGVHTLSATPGGGWGYASGTSMAAPHVAGAAAILVAAGTPPLQVKDHLARNSVVVPDLQGRASSSARLHLPTMLGGTPPPVVDERGLRGSFTGLAGRTEGRARTIGVTLEHADLGDVADPSLLVTAAYLHGGVFRAVQGHPVVVTPPGAAPIDTTTDLEGAVGVPLTADDVTAIVDGSYELAVDLETAAGTWALMVEVFSAGAPTPDAVVAAAAVTGTAGDGGGAAPAPLPPPGQPGGPIVLPAPPGGGGGGGPVPVVEVPPGPAPSSPPPPPVAGGPLPGGGGGVVVIGPAPGPGGIDETIIINPTPGGGGPLPGGGGGGGGVVTDGPLPGGGGVVTDGPLPGGGTDAPAPGVGTPPPTGGSAPDVPPPGDGDGVAPPPATGDDGEVCAPNQVGQLPPGTAPEPDGDGPAPAPDDGEPGTGEPAPGDGGPPAEDDDVDVPTFRFAPRSGVAGQPVTLQVRDLPEQVYVWFGEVRAGSVLVRTPGAMVVLAPRSAVGDARITIRDGRGEVLRVSDEVFEQLQTRGRRGDVPSSIDDVLVDVADTVAAYDACGDDSPPPDGGPGAPGPGGDGGPGTPAPGGGDAPPPGSGGGDGGPPPVGGPVPRGVLGQPTTLENGLTVDAYTTGHPIGWLASSRVPRCGADPCEGLTL